MRAQYAEDEDLDYADDAADLFYADRMFLIHAILKDIKEHHLLPSEYDWTRTSFYEHIRELYPVIRKFDYFHHRN